MDKQIKCNIRGIGDGVEGGIINLRSTVKAFYTPILKILLPKWPVKKNNQLATKYTARAVNLRSCVCWSCEKLHYDWNLVDSI